LAKYKLTLKDDVKLCIFSCFINSTGFAMVFKFSGRAINTEDHCNGYLLFVSVCGEFHVVKTLENN